MESTYTERDATNKRTFAMWQECGMQFRSNIVEPGGEVPLHKHSYAHVAAIFGPFHMWVNGVGPERVERGCVTIPAGAQHRFVYLGDTVGEVLCFWPIGHDGAAQ